MTGPMVTCVPETIPAQLRPSHAPHRGGSIPKGGAHLTGDKSHRQRRHATGQVPRSCEWVPSSTIATDFLQGILEIFSADPAPLETISKETFLSHL